MKKRAFALFASLSAFLLTGGMTCLADSIDPGPLPPITNNRSGLFYVIIAVAVVLVIVIAAVVINKVKKSKKK